MLPGIVLLPVMNVIAKSLTADYPLTQVVWARFLGHLVWVSLFFGPFLGTALLRAHHPREMIGRSFVFFASNCVFIAALPYIQLATASAIMFTTPLVVVALSVPLLKERVGPWRSAAVVVGFCGALVVIRPGTDVFQPAAVLTLLSAICLAGYQLWTRRLARHERPETLIIYSAPSFETVRSNAGLRPAQGMGEPARTNSVRAPHGVSQPAVEPDAQPHFRVLPLKSLYIAE